MNKSNEIFEDKDPLEIAELMEGQLLAVVNELKEMKALLLQRDNRIKDLEKQVEEMKNDPWSSRVTYDNVVDQIAACEDAKERDEARKLIEPLLKKEMATRFRKDIRRRAKELSEGSVGIEPEMQNAMKGNVTMNNPTFNAPLYGISGNRNVNLREPDYGKEG